MAVRIGLTGGIGSGKSTVLAMLQQLGATAIDADAISRATTAPGGAAIPLIAQKFGAGFIGPDGALDRAKMRERAYAHPEARRELEQIIHPRVAREQARLTRQAARNDPKAVVIYDVPLLYEAGIDKRVDRVIVVTADRETQIARLKKRNGFTRAEALRRIRSQMPLKKKVAAASYWVDGTTPRPRLLTLVRRLYRELRTLA